MTDGNLPFVVGLAAAERSALPCAPLGSTGAELEEKAESAGAGGFRDAVLKGKVVES